MRHGDSRFPDEATLDHDAIVGLALSIEEYGEWERLDPCQECGAASGEPCRDYCVYGRQP